MSRSMTLLILGLALAALLAACGTAGSPQPNPSGGSNSAPPSATGSAAETQRSDGGQVTVEATWSGPAAGAAFDLKLDTHSVDLDALDLSNALLRNDRGESLAAEPWTASKGGHHREGTLAFRGDVVRFLAGAKWIELVLPGIGGVPERDLRWPVGS
jgi:hypothetical protein